MLKLQTLWVGLQCLLAAFRLSEDSPQLETLCRGVLVRIVLKLMVLESSVIPTSSGSGVGLVPLGRMARIEADFPAKFS